MQTKHLGRQTIRFDFPPSYPCNSFRRWGKKEGEGPLKDFFDQINGDTKFGQNSWEKDRKSNANACIANCSEKK